MAEPDTDEQIARPPELAALGGISFAWNAFEYQCYQLFALIGRMDFEKAYILAHDLKTPAIMTRIIALAKYCDFNEPPEDTDVIDALAHLSRFSSICRENRNNLIHGIPITDGKTSNLAKLRGITYSPALIELDITLLDRVADDIYDLIAYTDRIIERVSERREAVSRAPLPDKPPLPNKLDHRQWREDD